ncbi:hypothetical protein BRADI_1g35616v3 [Brachypodium distachyon]|uniref:Uncharacterized protein n=1 Tax=Brachypodium distachyon TaxID=15368 RepID=A0A2K2DMW0_BRADI|nr:hypothetical protein BRADI_1g35616v3 [Brachypodium distachyon]
MQEDAWCRALAFLIRCRSLFFLVVLFFVLTRCCAHAAAISPSPAAAVPSPSPAAAAPGRRPQPSLRLCRTPAAPAPSPPSAATAPFAFAGRPRPRSPAAAAPSVLQRRTSSGAGPPELAGSGGRPGEISTSQRRGGWRLGAHLPPAASFVRRPLGTSFALGPPRCHADGHTGGGRGCSRGGGSWWRGVRRDSHGCAQAQYNKML